MKRKPWIFRLFALLLVPAVARAQLKDNDYVAIIGDSITEQRQYSAMIQQYLLVCKPAQNLNATQFGWGGEQVGGFNGRMAADCLPFKPTVATTCYGMNDGGYGPLSDGRRTAYTNGTKTMVQKLKEGGVRFIVVGSPGVVDTDAFKRPGTAPDVYNKTLSELRDIAKQVAADEGVGFANVHDAMMDAMTKAKAKYGKDYHVAGGDGVHPAANGHVVMAYAFLKALGVDGNIGTITVDLGKSTAEATDGHKVLGVKDGQVQIESTRYPFCFSGDPAKPNATSGIIEFVPFNDDLNRFKLVVTGGSADKLKVTWGKTSKEFPAADLAKGVNLAAEFLDNPFSEPFAAVALKVQEQQGAEVGLIKQMMHSLPVFEKQLPEKKDTLNELSGAILAKDESLRKASAAAVVPVTHTIQIEAVK